MHKTTQRLIELDKKYLWHPFTQMTDWLGGEPVIIERGEGYYLMDTEGRRYIDGVSSLWCNVHGHSVRVIDEAIRRQLDEIAHSSLLGLGQNRSIELAERLIRIAPAGLAKVFYSDSGATSVEIALKMAYQYWHNKGDKQRTRFIALRESYHGDTIGSVSVGGMELFHGIYKPLLFETLFAPTPHPYRFNGTPQQCAQHSLDAMESLLKDNAGTIAGIILEPKVQGAAGMIVHPAGFLKAVETLARKYDVLLIVDEVATGFGRTGRMFACEHEDVRPDLICVAKGISGGYLPLAATLTTQAIFDAFLGRVEDFKTFYHGHTYTGNALACAAGLASLDLFEKNHVLKKMPEKTDLIFFALEDIRALPFVGDVRQCGMMVGIELVKNKDTKESFEYKQTVGARLCAAMRPKGVLLRPLGDVIVLMPAPAMDRMTLTSLLAVVCDSIQNDLPEIIKGL
ncbi:MAG: adenosylmethionine--8-amino-7-oxononanoate transaminase [Anaerohalosphaeraceae bacterium]